MKTLCLILAAAGCLAAADPKPATAKGASDKMEVIATVYPSKDLVKQVLGDDLGGYIYVVEVEIHPRTEEGVRLDRDDFQLLTTNDGQKTKPFSPSQLAGKGALVLRSVPGPTSGAMGQNNGPVWGGIGGRPQRLPGSGGSMGSPTAGSATTNEVSMKDDKNEKVNPMKAVLEQKELPQKEVKENTKGFLYFPIEGKHKPKNIVLLYRGVGGRIDIEFK